MFHFFVLNLDSWFGFIFYYILFYQSYAINNFISFFERYIKSIILYLSPRDIYLFLADSLSCSFVIVFELFSSERIETFVILLAILLPIKSTVSFAVSWITPFNVNLSASAADCLSWSRFSRLNWIAHFYHILL